MTTPLIPACAKEEPTLQEAIDRWGLAAQLGMLQEECAEVIVTVSHLFRSRPGSQEHLGEELADVLIMVQQIVGYLDSEDVIRDHIKDKLARLKARLASEEKTA